ncbi:terminase large subunit [Allorhizobium pseudoryzae]|uniref:terminase large subunit n=1 Tax=Allorhizobium pseudoryzae TaxID=379684 RepID=UPI003D023F78
MGARGPGARPRKRVLVPPGQKALPPPRKRPPPWKRKGLSKAEQVIKFLESLPVTKGRLAGKKMKLIPAQREFVEEVFKTDKRGRFIVKTAIISQAKGNGKSGLTAGICLAALLGPLSEERGAVYSASIDRGKAGVIFEEMVAIIRRVPDFDERCNVTAFHKKIEVLDGDGKDSKFEALSADASGAQGLAPTLWCFDELGESKDGKLLEVLLESEGKRNHTFGIVLSTQAESDEHPLSKLIDDAKANPDPRTYLMIHEAPRDADPWDDETIKLANPAWGTHLDIEAIRNARDRARRIPAFEAAYRRLRLNQRIDMRSDERLVTASVWKECAAPIDRKSLAGKVAFAGLDLAGKNDLTALVLAFPSDDVPAHYEILCWFWTPEGRMQQRTPAEQARFREWINQGFMTLVPGDVVTTATIARDLVAICQEFDVRTINYDKYHIDYLRKDLAELDVVLPMDSFGQGHSKAMAPAIEFVAEAAVTGRLHHPSNPVLTASIAGAIVGRDKVGNPMIEKEKSNKLGPVRVDGAVALVMAMGAAKSYEPPPKKPSLSGMLRNPVMIL